MDLTVAEQRDHLIAGSEPAGAALPMVIVGAGPVGIRVLRELRQRQPGQAVIIYGDESFDPYNRVQLSGLLSGQHKVHDLALATDLLRPQCQLTEFRRVRVERIDPQLRAVTDRMGRRQHYSTLILATGSRPFIPSIPGIELGGVFTFRDMADAEKLAARRVQSSNTVVLGAGLLGVEAARGMQRHNTRVTLVDHNPHPMSRQLDDTAGQILAGELSDSGIELLTGTSIRMLLGTHKVEAVILQDGTRLACDTVVLATGIRPRIDLARTAGLAFGRGITVNARMQTSNPDIYAVGECCELNGELFGLVAPGYEQAAIASRNIAGEAETADYRGTQLATSLKVAGLSVFSMGDANPPASTRALTWRKNNCYRRLNLVGGRIVGINAIGDWPQLPALRELARASKWISPLRLWRFHTTGDLLPATIAGNVASWPAATVVCNCNSVSAGELRKAICAGSASIEALTTRTRAGSDCGSCKPLLQELLGDSGPRQAVKGYRSLAALAMAALAITLTALFISVPYPESVRNAWDWGELWRDGLLKQVSGYTILGLSVFSLLLSLRKRLSWLKAGDFDWWRLAHVTVTALALAALATHTGLRFGEQLNLALNLCFLALLAAGAVLAASIAAEHRLSPARARTLRRVSLWTHILLSWPLPALLTAHILKTYYF